MPEWLEKVFSGGVSLMRVRPAGLALMAIAVILAAAAGPVSSGCPENRKDHVKNGVKIAALIICAAGALIAIL